MDKKVKLITEAIQETEIIKEAYDQSKPRTIKMRGVYMVSDVRNGNNRIYKYDDLKPMGQTIALASISNKSSRVKSAAFNLFAHWACPEALKLLLQVDVPQQPWIAMKYNSVKESLEKKCFTQER